MNKNDVKNIVIGIFILFFLGLFSFQLSNIFPPNDDPFLSLAVLNNEAKVGLYFQNSSSVSIGEEHSWSILVENRASSPELVSIRIKIVNDEKQSPNQIECIPSQAIVLYERVFINDPNTAVTLPFLWEITGYDEGVLLFDMNNTAASLEIELNQSNNVILIIELWKYDRIVEDYVFKWQSRSRDQCVWNKVSFSLDI